MHLYLRHLNLKLTKTLLFVFLQDLNLQLLSLLLMDCQIFSIYPPINFYFSLSDVPTNKLFTIV